MNNQLYILWLVLIALAGNTYAQTLNLQAIQTDGPVNAIVQSGDTVFMGGTFNTAGYHTGRGAKLSAATGSPDLTFPAVSGEILTAVPDGAGGWYIGGDFSEAGNTNRSKLAHILSDNTVDPSFNTGSINGTILQLALSGNYVYLSGSFTTVAGVAVPYLARVDKSTGTVDVSWKPEPNNTVNALVIEGNKVFAGGVFTRMAGKPQAYFATINTSNGEAMQGINMDSYVYSFARENGQLYIGGRFSNAGFSHPYAALLAAGNNIPEAGFPSFNGRIAASVPDGAGGWYVGGYFTTVNGADRRYVAHILPDLTVDPNFIPGTINSGIDKLFVSGDKVYIAGSFTSVGGVAIKNLARLNKTTGTLDNAWKPEPNGQVKTLAVTGTAIYVGGQFTIIGGQNRKYLASLNHTNGNADFFDPQPSSFVLSMATDDSFLYAGGFFSQIAGQARRNIASFNITTQELTTWNPDANGNVETMALSGTTLYVGGSFTQIGGQSRRYMAAVNTTTGSATAWNPSPDKSPNTVFIDGTTVYTSGTFTQIGGQSRSFAAALNSTDGNATAWNPKPNSTVQSISAAGNKILLGGMFTLFNPISQPNLLAVNMATGDISSWNNATPNNHVYALAAGNGILYMSGIFTKAGSENRQYMAAINTSTGAVTNWNPKPNQPPSALAVTGNTVYAGGNFTQIGGQTLSFLAALDNASGNASGWNPQPNKQVKSLSVHNNIILAGGSFDFFKAEQRKGLLAFRLSTNQLIAWNPGSSQNYIDIKTLAVSGNTVYAGGDFTTIGGQARNYIAALDRSTGNATAWNPNASHIVKTIALSGNTVYAGGDFTTIGGQVRNRIAALDNASGNATAWNPNANNPVEKLWVDGSTIYAGGNFTTIGGQARNRIAALDNTSGNATAWNPGANKTVSAILTDEAVVYIGGTFDEAGGTNRQGIAAIDKATGTVTAWNPQLNYYVRTLFKKDNYLFAGGTFTQAGSQKVNYFAVLDATDAKPQPIYPAFNSYVHTIHYRDTTLLVGGGFTHLGSNARQYAARFNLRLGATSAKTDQTISFTVGDKSMLNASFTLDAKASSGLPVSYTLVSGPAQLNGNQVTITASGTVQIKASQAGNELFHPAPDVTVTFTVSKASQTVTFPAISNKTVTDAPFELEASASSGLPVSFVLMAGPATLNGNLLTVTGPGTITLKALQEGNNVYEPAEQIRSFCVAADAPAVIEGSAEACLGEHTYTVPAVPGVTYIWQISGGGTLTAAGNSAKVNWTQTGTHTVTVAPSGDCTADGTSKSITVEVKNTVSPGLVSNMLPADMASGLPLPLQLSWLPASSAATYDVYIWPENEPRPYSPYTAGTGNVNLRIESGLTDGVIYKWQIVAKNNCASTEGPIQRFSINTALMLPDLVIQQMEFTQNATAGQAQTLSWTVKNAGNASTNGSRWKDYIYLSTDLDLRRGDDIFLAEFPNQSFLQANQSYTQTKTITLPTQFNGSYYLFVITDNTDAYCFTAEDCNIAGGNRGRHGSTVDESNENNNYAYKPVTIGYGNLPDLQVSSLGVPTATFGGNKINITYQVTNKGKLAAVGKATSNCPQRGWYDRVFISSEPEFNIQFAHELPRSGFFRNNDLKDCTTQEGYVDFLSPDSSYTRAHTVEIPHSYAGTYYLYVMANGFEEVFEGSHTANNIRRSEAITISLSPPADLEITQVTAPAGATAGQPIRIEWTGKNQGANAPRESTWTDSVYVSAQENFDVAAATGVGRAIYSRGTLFKPGDTYQQSLEFNLPNGISGNYYVFVKTDAGNSVFEYTYKQNNIARSASPVQVSLAPPADLVITSVQAPDSVQVNKSFSVAWTVKNQGTGETTQPWSDHIYCSTDSLVSMGNLYQIGSFAHTTRLTSGQEITSSTEVLIPDVFAGRKVYLYLLADGDKQVYEAEAENNNRASSAESHNSGTAYVMLGNTANDPSVLKPDLRVISFVAADSAFSGKHLSVNWSVANGGSLHAGSTNGWSDHLYLSADTTLDVSDQLLSQHTFTDQLQAGAQYMQTARIRIPDESTGAYYLVIRTDAENKVENDSTKLNNTTFRPLFVTPSPVADLVVTDIQPVPALYAGTQFYLKYIVKNQGPGATTVDEWYDGVYFSPSSSIGKNREQSGSGESSGVLAAGATYTDSLLVSVPSYLEGNYYLIVRTDNSNRVFEGNAGEGNNTKTMLVQVQTPGSISQTDLVVTDLQVPASAMVGKAITAGYTFKNVGAHPVIGTLTNGFYLSPDQTFEGNLASLIQSYTRPSFVLAPGEFITSQFTGIVTVPKAGNLFGLARVNLLNSINESDLANNTLASASPVLVDAVALPLDVELSDTLHNGSPAYFRITTGAGLDLQVILTSGLSGLPGSNQLYLAYDRIPTPFDYDATGTDGSFLNQQLFQSGTKAGNYFLRVENTGPMTTQPVTLLAKALPFSIVKISPAVLGQDEVSSQVYGAGFKANTQVALKNKAGAVVSTARISRFVNGTHLHVKWNLLQVPLGTYDVVAINADGQEVKLADGITIKPSSGYAFEFTPLLPNQVRREQNAFFTFKGKNTGNINIPVVHGELTMPGYAVITEVVTEGNVMKQSRYHQKGYMADAGDWYDENGLIKLPFISRNLAPGEEFSVSFYVKGFEGNSFPIQPRVVGYATEQFVRRTGAFIEYLRENVLVAPSYFGINEQHILYNLAAQGTKPFMDILLQNYFEAGLFTPADTVGVNLTRSWNELLDLDTDFKVQLPDFNYSPGASPGLMRIAGNTTFRGGEAFLFEINKSQYWPEYTGARGNPGKDPGWDLIEIEGALHVNATAANPFNIFVASLSYGSQPGPLAGWYPAGDACYPILVATGGIIGFSADKFSINATLFQLQNQTHGGKFALSLKKGADASQADTLFLCFEAYKPGPGEDGVPGAPGVNGEPGSPGGKGGPGMGVILPGKGGKGGDGGGAAGPGQPGSPGGPGGPGGDGGPGQAGGPGGEGGRGGRSTGGIGPGGAGGIGGTGPGGSGRSGSSGSGGFGEGDAPFNPCGQGNSVGNCEDAFDYTKAGAGNPLKDIPTEYAKKVTKDNCAANAWVLCADALTSPLTSIPGTIYDGDIPIWTPLMKTVSCSLKMADCMNEKKRGPNYDGRDKINDLLDGVDCLSGLLDMANCGLKKPLCTPVGGSCDPNEIVGPASYGPSQMVSAEATLPYTIHFENDSLLATTAAQRVVIRQAVDPHLNPLSFRVGSFNFANRSFAVPDGVSSYFAVLNLEDSIGFNVEVTAGVDVVKKELFWVFQSIDPATGLPPSDPLAGFLLVNNAKGDGKGFVSYTIKAATMVQTGDTITAMAKIYFDTNDPISTNTWLNTLDAAAPVSAIDTLPAVTGVSIPITVKTQDDEKGSGVKNCNLYVSKNGGAYSLLAPSLAMDSTFMFQGEPGASYCLYALATDNTGNVERAKQTADACFQIPGNMPAISVVQPAAHSSYCLGDTVMITWKSEHIEKAAIYYSSNGGTTYHLITGDYPATDSVFAWQTPDDLPSSGTFKIKVASSEDASVFAVSEGVFAIRRLAGNISAGEDETVCADAPAFSLAGFSPAGGTWSGNGVSADGIFTPSPDLTGTHTLTYRVSINGCSEVATKTITVKTPPAVNFAPLPDVSVNEAALALSGGFPEGGVYSGTGVSNNQFNPAVAGEGTHQITYTVTDSSGCTGTATQNITVRGATGNPVLQAPAQVTASALSASQILLNWLDNSTTETGFVVEKATSAGGPYQETALLPANANSFTDNQLAANTTYFYRIKAVAALESSAYSPVVSATTTGSVHARIHQSITFEPLPAIQLSNAPVELAATASSGLPVSFLIVSGPATLENNLLHLTGIGTVVIRAIQHGNDAYHAASPVERAFAVTDPAKKNQQIVFEAIAGKTFGDLPFPLQASATSGLPVSFEVVSGAALISGSRLIMTGAGKILLRATQAGNNYFNPAPPVEQSFVAGRATPQIYWNNPADITAGTALSALQLNATAKTPGIMVYTPGVGTVLNARSNQALSVAFTPADTHNYTSTTARVWIQVHEAIAGCPGNGNILWEYWDSTSRVPSGVLPHRSGHLTSFEAPGNLGDTYASRIRGYVCPPVSGDYTFYIAGDDQNELYLSTDSDPEHKQKIAFVNGWTFEREWNKYASQQSRSISLQAGQKYYIEAVHREGAGNDHLAVAWQLPGSTTIEVIPGARISPFIPEENPAPAVSIISPASNSVFTAGLPLTIQAQATDVYGNISKVEFYAGDTKLGEATVYPYNFIWMTPVAGNYTLTARATDNSGQATVSEQVMITVDNPSVVSCGATGNILREHWGNTNRVPSGVLPNSFNYLTSFEAPGNTGDNYASRIRGYICPPVSGDYTFYISGDDQNELYLSTDSDPEHKQKIAFVNGWTFEREWNKYASQQSQPINLKAGQKYYIEAVHREGAGNDHLAVAWMMPDGVSEAPIPGNRLSPFIPEDNPAPVVRITSPVGNGVFTAGLPLTIQAQATDVYGNISKVAFYAGDMKLGEVTAYPYNFTWMNPAAGDYKLMAKAIDQTGLSATSAEVVITVLQESDITCAGTGSITREYWENTNGVPENIVPTAISYLTSFEAPSNTGNYYASRIRGYVCPPVSGDYTFYISGDDQNELYLSTDSDPEHKQKIAFVNGWTFEREWNKYASQQSQPINLKAGQKYYIEAVHREGAGNDHLAVAWQLPGSAAIEVIPGARLSPMVPEANAAATPNARLSHELSGSGFETPLTVEAFPNPFVQQVTITFTATQTGNASLILYDVKGALIEQLFNGEAEAGKTYTFDFDGSRHLSGVYICRFIHHAQVVNKRLVLIK